MQQNNNPQIAYITPLNNLQNLLGKTVDGTIFLGEIKNEKNKENIQVKNQIPEKKINKNENKTNQIPIPIDKGKNNIIKHRNSDGNKIQSRKISIENQYKKPNKDPHLRFRNSNTIVRNGKLISNIDINNDTQGLMSNNIDRNN